ncbi:MAG TPA: sigma-54 dependent transcriptional regulator [Candidatus Sumerlaeota bacterium]|nr:sigma-54 dependent transcriptional regulator [Candidatus Sumerlaeota bacterium]
MAVIRTKRVLVVDDQPQACELLARLLRAEDCEVTAACSTQEAQRLLLENDFLVCFVNLHLTGGDGLEVLRFCHRESVNVPAILLTSHACAESAIQALRMGAADYLTKPLHADEVRAALQRVVEARLALEAEPAGSVEPVEEALPDDRRTSKRLVGKSRRMQVLRDLIQTVAASSSTVLIRGESGTGKELIAQALHHLSPRARKPLIPVNCGAIPEDLLESELFGHVRGSFTGAISDRPGRFVLANGGTIFLDEIGDMSPKLQVKVLRVLQEQELEPVGGAEIIRVDVRVVAATNVDLEHAVETRRFREDLYYRLNVIPIEAPPLREHIEDLPLLARHFLKAFNKRQPRHVEDFSAEVLEALKRYPWPGNVRELENLVERMTILARGSMVEMDDLPERFRPQPATAVSRGDMQARFAPVSHRFEASGPSEAAALFAAASGNRIVPAVATYGETSPPGAFAPSLPSPVSGIPYPFYHPSAASPGTRAQEGVTVEERFSMNTAPHSLPYAAAGFPEAGGVPPVFGGAEQAGSVLPLSIAAGSPVDLGDLVDEYERRLIVDALEKSNGVKSRAAKILGIKRTTLVEKMKKKNIAFEKK